MRATVFQYHGSSDLTCLTLHLTYLFRAGIGHVGEVIIIKNVSRYCDDVYECVADNGVPPAVSRQMRVTVECKYDT